MYILPFFRLKQIDEGRRKFEKDRHEMGKTFARAADDQDMNDQLKVPNCMQKLYFN